MDRVQVSTMDKVISSSSNDETIQLHDGRMLGYTEYGSPQGKTIFYFHGHPGSRFEATFLCKATYYPDEGHISIIVNYAEEIVKALT